MKKDKIKISIFSKYFSAFIALILLLFFGFPVLANGKAVIRIFGETTVQGERVTLGEIAEISDAREEIKNRLAVISLGYAPNVGMTRELHKDRISLAISAAGFAESDFILDAPPKIIVRRAAQIVGHDALREAVEKAILDDFQNKNITAKIVRLDLPSDLPVPTGKTEIRASVANIAIFFAPFSVSLEIRVDEQVVSRFSATAQVEATAEVLVTVKDLVSGDRLAASDVRVETRRLEKPLNNYLRDSGRLRGMVLLKYLPAGAELTTDAVAAGYVIRAGDSVRIVGASGKMQIIINGEARSSGRIGDRVSVKNLQSGAILQALVIDEGSVKVIF